jgi:hypothetical protein
MPDEDEDDVSKVIYYRSPSSTGLLEPTAPYGGMPELLAPKPQVCWNHQLPVVECQNYKLPIHRFARTASTVWWYAKATGSQGDDLYKW